MLSMLVSGICEFKKDYLKELKNFMSDEEADEVLSTAIIKEGHFPYELHDEWNAESDNFKWTVALNHKDEELVYFQRKTNE